MDLNEVTTDANGAFSPSDAGMDAGTVTTGMPPTTGAGPLPTGSDGPHTLGYYQSPTEYQGLNVPELPTSFANPYAPIPDLNIGGGNSSGFDLERAMGALANKAPSFQAKTAPVFFDWDKLQTDRYINSDYFQEMGFVPGRDNESLYGYRQTFGDTMENAFAGMGKLAWNSFKDGWKGWGNLVDALFNWGSDHSFKERLLGTPEELAEMNREQTEIFNKYAIFSTPESEGSIFNRQFLGNLIQQGGFAIGTLAQFLSEELITLGAGALLKPLTGARSVADLIRAGIKEEELARDMVNITARPWKSMEAAKTLYEGIKAMGKKVVDLTPFGEFSAIAKDFSRAKKFGATNMELAGLTLNGLRRTLAETNMAFTESRMEAAGTYADLRQQLYDKTLFEKGSVSFEDEQRIDAMAQQAAWKNFGMNALTISIMNRIQYDNIINSFGSAKRVLRHLSEEGDDILKVTGKAAKDLTIPHEAGDILIKEGETATKLYNKNLFRNFKEVAEDFGKRTAAWEATKSTGRNLMKWELSEGLQELIQEGSNQAVKDYYADLYNNGHASWSESIGEGIESQLNTQGMKTFLMGAMTGRLISPFSKGFEKLGEVAFTNKNERDAALASRAQAMDVLNAFYADPSRFAPEQLANIKIQNKVAQKMEEALSERDKYKYENAKDAAFAKAIFAAKKLKMMGAFKQSFEDYGKHFDDQQFFEAFGVDMTDENRGNAQKYMKSIADRAEAVSKRYDELQERYRDIIPVEKFRKEDRFAASIANRAFDDAIEIMATNEYRAEQAAKRADEIMLAASKIKGIGQSAQFAFRVLGNDESLDGEILLLSKELAEDAVRNEKEVVSKKEDADKNTTAPTDNTPDSNTPESTTPKQQPPISSDDPQVEVVLSAKEKELQALLQIKEHLNTVWLPSKNLGTPVPEETKQQLLQGLKDYITAVNAKSGIQTDLTGTDLDDFYTSLSDMRTLRNDQRDFMDAYALMANPKKFMGAYIRLREGLEYVQMIKRRTEEEEKQQKEAAAKAVAGAGGDPIHAGDTVGSYHGYKVGDKVLVVLNNEKEKCSIERISTTRVELLNNVTNKRINLSLDAFDELVAHNEIELDARVVYLNEMLPDGSKQIDSKRGVFLVALTKSNKFTLIDKAGNIYTVDGQDQFDKEDEARAARDKLIEQHKKQEAADNAPFTFDGQQIKRNDVLIDQAGQRFRVVSKGVGNGQSAMGNGQSAMGNGQQSGVNSQGVGSQASQSSASNQSGGNQQSDAQQAAIEKLEKSRKEALRPYDERDEKSLQARMPNNPNHPFIQVGSKWNDGTNATVEITNNAPDYDGRQDGYVAVTRMLEPAVKGADGKMTKAARVETTLFNTKEDADKFIQERYEKVKAEAGKKQKEINAQFDADLAALRQGQGVGSQQSGVGRLETIETTRKAEMDAVVSHWQKETDQKLKAPYRTAQQIAEAIKKAGVDNKQIIDELEAIDNQNPRNKELWDLLWKQLSSKGLKPTIEYKEGNKIKIGIESIHVNKNGETTPYVVAENLHEFPEAFQVGDRVSVRSSGWPYDSTVTKVNDKGRILEAVDEDGNLRIYNGTILTDSQSDKLRDLTKNFDDQIAALAAQGNQSGVGSQGVGSQQDPIAVLEEKRTQELEGLLPKSKPLVGAYASYTFYAGPNTDFYIQLFTALQQGTNLVNGKAAKEIDQLKPLFDAGKIKSEKDVYLALHPESKAINDKYDALVKAEQAKQGNQSGVNSQGVGSQGSQTSQTSQGGQVASIEIAPIAGGTNLHITSLQGYTLATEAARQRRRRPAFKLTNVQTPGMVQAYAKPGQTPEEADRELEELLLKTTHKDLVSNLVLQVSTIPNDKQTSDVVRKGQPDENPRLVESTGSLLVELLYQGKPIGVLNNFDRYQYVNANNEIVETSTLTVDQFKQIFDTDGEDARELLKKFQDQRDESETVYRHLFRLKQSGKSEKQGDKEVVKIDYRSFSPLLRVRTNTGFYDYVPQAVTPLKDLRFSTVKGKTVLIVRRTDNAPQVQIEKGLSQQEEKDLIKKIEEQKKQLEKLPGNTLAVVELPNGDLRFVPLLAPAQEAPELETLTQAIKAQQAKTLIDNVTLNAQGGKVEKDQSFNSAFNNSTLKQVLFSVTAGEAEYNIQLHLTASGNLTLHILNRKAGSKPFIVDIIDPKRGAFAATNFTELLTTINQSIETHNQNSKTDPQQKLNFQLTAENFRKYPGDFDQAQVREMPAFVSKQVVRGVSLLVKPKSDTNAYLYVPKVVVGVGAKVKQSGGGSQQSAIGNRQSGAGSQQQGGSNVSSGSGGAGSQTDTVEANRKREMDAVVGKTQQATDALLNAPVKTAQQVEADIKQAAIDHKQLIDEFENPATSDDRLNELVELLTSRLAAKGLEWDIEGEKVKIQALQIKKMDATDVTAESIHQFPEAFTVDDRIDVQVNDKVHHLFVSNVNAQGKILEATEVGTDDVRIYNGNLLSDDQVKALKEIEKKYAALRKAQEAKASKGSNQGGSNQSSQSQGSSQSNQGGSNQGGGAGQPQTNTPPPPPLKVDRLADMQAAVKKMEDALVDLQLQVFDEYMDMLNDGDKAEDAMRKDKRILELEGKIKEQQHEVDKEVNAYKVIGAEEWHNKWSKAAVVHIDNFIKWVGDKLPNIIDVEVAEVIKNNMTEKGVTVGKFVYSLKTLSEKKKGIIHADPNAPFKYHEAFHAVFRLLLTDERIAELLDVARKEVRAKLKKEGKTLASELRQMRETAPQYYEGMSDKELEEHYCEEYMADLFDAWMLDPKVKTDPRNKNFFRRILDWIKGLFEHTTPSELETLFYDINKGEYKENRLALNRYTQAERLQVAPQVEVPKAIPWETVEIQDSNGNTKKIQRFLPEQQATEFAASIAATYYNRREQVTKNGEPKSNNELLEEIFADYANLYDKTSPQYKSLRDHPDKRARYFKITKELDRLRNVFTQDESKEALKEAVIMHQRSMDYLQAEEDENEEEIVSEYGDRGGMEFLKNKESYGGFGSFPKWLRQYISTTTYAATDMYGNTQLKDGEPLLQAVDATRVYAGILKVVAGYQDEHKMLLRMQEFARYNEQSGHFVRRFFADMGIDVTADGYTVSKEEMAPRFMEVMKRFQQYTPDYLQFSRDMTKGTTDIVKANQRDAGIAQFSRWYNAYAQRFESPYLQSDDKDAFLAERLAVLEEFVSHANDNPIDNEELRQISEKMSTELSLKLGWNLHPTYIQYSLACARTSDNLTPAQIQLVKTFGDVESLKADEVNQLIDTLVSGRNPFSYGKDVVNVEEQAQARNEEGGDDPIFYSSKQLMKMAYANSIFDETVNTTSFRNADGELVYAHQLPTYHLVKVRELAQLLATGAVPTEALNDLLNDPYLAQHFLLNQDQFRQMAADLKVSRIEGINAKYQNARKGVVYGKFTEREMMVSLFELYGANKHYEGANGQSFYATQHLIRVIEASNTGDTVNLPAFAAVKMDVLKGLVLSTQAETMLVAEVRREFDRIGRVKKEIAQIEAEKMAYEEKGTPRKTQEIDEYHNTRGAKVKPNESPSGDSSGKAVPRGLTLFKTRSLLNQDLVAALEKEAQAGTPNFNQYTDQIKAALQAALIGTEEERDALVKNPDRAEPTSLLHKTLKELLKNQIVTADKKGKLQNALLPRFMVEGFTNWKGETNEEKNEALNLQADDLYNNVAQVVLNDYLNTMSFNQLLLGDQARSLVDFVDMVKRAKGANGSGSSIYSDILAPSLGITHANTHSHIVHFDDFMVEGLYAGKRVREADGQMYMTVKALRYTLFGLGKLTPKIAALLDKLEKGEAVRIYEVFGKDGSIAYNGQTNSLKMVYYDGSRYIKISAFVLTKELTSQKDLYGSWVAREGNEELHQLRTRLETFEEDHNTITMAVPKSSSKNEKANVARGIMPYEAEVEVNGKKEKRMVDPIEDWNFQKLDNRYWRLQIENRTNKMRITDPTQAKHIIMHEQNDELEVEFAWGTNGESVPTKMNVGQLKKLYREKSAERVQWKYRNARSELFDLQGSLDEVAKSIREGKITPKLALFQQRALETLRQTGSDSQLLEFFSLDENGQPRYNLNHPVTLDKFTQLFLAHFSKGVLNEKIPGHAITLVSSFGMRVLKRVLEIDENGQPKRWEVIMRHIQDRNPGAYKGALRWEDGVGEDQKARARELRQFHTLAETFEANQKAGKPTYILDDLRHNVPLYELDKNGRIKRDAKGREIILDYYTEYMLPPHSADIMELVRHGDSIPEAVAKAFGVRIPSQAKHSAVNLRLVDFLPAYYGSSGMFAPELVQISGADFDIDMLYTSTKEFYTRRVDGKLEYIEYGKTTHPGEQFLEYVQYQKKSNRSFKEKYGELLRKDPRYDGLKDKLEALRQEIREVSGDIKDLKEQVTEAYYSRDDENFQYDSFDTEYDNDWTEIIKKLKKQSYAKRGERNELFKQYAEADKDMQNLTKKITYDTLKALSLPTDAKAYAEKVEKEGEQNLGKLNNLILEAKMKMLGNEHMVKWEERPDGTRQAPIAYEVANIEPLERVLKYLKDTFPNLKSRLEEGSEDVDSFLGKVIAFRNNKEGAANIGPAVNAMLAYALMNAFNVQIRTERLDWKGKKKIPLWHFKLNGVPFTSYGNTRTLSGKDEKGNGIFDGNNRIMNELSALVTAMTDNAKERLAAKLGLNLEAVGIVANMVAQGVPMQSAITFILQPVVQKYYATTRNLKSGLKTEEEENASVWAAGQKMLAELKANVKRETADGKQESAEIELTDELLKENILNDGENKKYELAVFESFLNLKKQTEYFNKVSGIMKLAKGLGTNFEAMDAIKEKVKDLKLYEEDHVFDKLYVPFDLRQVLTGMATGRDKDKPFHEVMAAYLGILEEASLLAKPVFIERTNGYQRMAEVILSNLRIPNIQKEWVTKRLKRETICNLSFLLYKRMLEERGRGDRLVSLSNAMIYDAEALKMPEGFLDVVDTVLAIRERLPDNYFVRQFLDVLPTTFLNGTKGMQENPYNSTGINKVEVNSWAKLDQLQTERLQDSFLEIFQNDGRDGKKGTQELAWSLFHYLLVKDGGQFKSGTFIRYIPPTMFQDLLDATAKVGEAMYAGLESDKFKSIFGEDGNTLLQGFAKEYLTHVNNREFIRQIDLGFGMEEDNEEEGSDTRGEEGDLDWVFNGQDPEQVEEEKNEDTGSAEGGKVQQPAAPRTFHFSEDGTVLQVNVENGVRQKLIDPKIPWTAEEKKRASENWADLQSRGFWKMKITVPQRTGSSEKKDVLRFPFVIKAYAPIKGVNRLVYYQLSEVDGKPLDADNPLKGIGKDRASMGGKSAKYRVLEGLHGGANQWTAILGLEKPDTRKVLRERKAVLNNGGHRLDAPVALRQAQGDTQAQGAGSQQFKNTEEDIERRRKESLNAITYDLDNPFDPSDFSSYIVDAAGNKKQITIGGQQPNIYSDAPMRALINEAYDAELAALRESGGGSQESGVNSGEAPEQGQTTAEAFKAAFGIDVFFDKAKGGFYFEKNGRLLSDQKRIKEKYTEFGQSMAAAANQQQQGGGQNRVSAWDILFGEGATNSDDPEMQGIKERMKNGPAKGCGG